MVAWAEIRQNNSATKKEKDLWYSGGPTTMNRSRLLNIFPSGTREINEKNRSTSLEG